MEANVYERVADYLMLISRTELLTCTATQTSFNRIKEQSAQVSLFFINKNLLRFTSISL